MLTTLFDVIKKWLVDHFNQLIETIRTNPVELIADLIIYGIILYLTAIIINFVLKKVFLRHRRLKRNIKQFSEYFKIPFSKFNIHLTFFLNILQIISIIILIISSDNILNTIKLYKAESVLSKVEEELETTRRELKNVKTTLAGANILLDSANIMIEHTKVKNNEMEAEINKKEKELNRNIYNAHIKEYFNTLEEEIRFVRFNSMGKEKLNNIFNNVYNIQNLSSPDIFLTKKEILKHAMDNTKYFLKGKVPNHIIRKISNQILKEMYTSEFFNQNRDYRKYIIDIIMRLQNLKTNSQYDTIIAMSGFFKEISDIVILYNEDTEEIFSPLSSIEESLYKK